MTTDTNYAKILVRYYSRVLEEETVETMWATIVDEQKGLYKVDNIPFYGPSIAPDDLVLAEYDESEKMLTYRHTVEHSGNSVVQVVLLNEGIKKEAIQEIMESFDCPWEGLNENYFVIEIPAISNYELVIV